MDVSIVRSRCWRAGSLVNLMRRTFVFTVMLTVLISDLFMPLSFVSDDNALDGDARSIAGANTNAVDFGK
jgi:hypothetical protein